jgi:F-type H+-transporting ATPase subunit b
LNALFEQLGIDPTIIFVNILGFVLLLWILKKVLYTPVNQMLHDRSHEIESNYEAAESEKAKMEELRQDYEQRISVIEAEAREKINAAVKEGQALRDDLLEEARSKAEDVMRRAEEELARERDKTMHELRTEVVDIAVSAAGKLIEQSLDESAHRKLVSGFIQDLEARK